MRLIKLFLAATVLGILVGLLIPRRAHGMTQSELYAMQEQRAVDEAYMAQVAEREIPPSRALPPYDSGMKLSISLSVGLFCGWLIAMIGAIAYDAWRNAREFRMSHEWKHKLHPKLAGVKK